MNIDIKKIVIYQALGVNLWQQDRASGFQCPSKTDKVIAVYFVKVELRGILGGILEGNVLKLLLSVWDFQYSFVFYSEPLLSENTLIEMNLVFFGFGSISCFSYVLCF